MPLTPPFPWVHVNSGISVTSAFHCLAPQPRSASRSLCAVAEGGVGGSRAAAARRAEAGGGAPQGRRCTAFARFAAPDSGTPKPLAHPTGDAVACEALLQCWVCCARVAQQFEHHIGNQQLRRSETETTVWRSRGALLCWILCALCPSAGWCYFERRKPLTSSMAVQHSVPRIFLTAYPPSPVMPHAHRCM